MANYFTDRIVQHPGRVVMTPVAGQDDTYDLSRAEGTITEEGTPFNAESFNGIADLLMEDTIEQITGRVWYGTCPTASSGTGANPKIVTVDPGFTLEVGVTIAVKFDNAAGGIGYGRALNVNGTGEIPIMVKGMTGTMQYEPWSAGDVVLFVYDGTYWQMVSTPTVTNNGNAIQIGQMLIQWGNLSASAPANNYQDSTGTFPIPFASQPTIQLTTFSVSSAAEFAQVEICLSAISATGFSVRAFNYGSTGRSPAVRWLAIGIV